MGDSCAVQCISNHSENICYRELLDLKIILMDPQDSEHVEVVDTIKKLRLKWTEVQHALMISSYSWFIPLVSP